jgi:hypothetical protein
VYGQSVTLTATINGANGAVKGRVKQRDLSGTVAWSANTGCGTTTVTAGNPGVATCTTSSLAVGTDTITATYSGDSNHSGSAGTLSGGQSVTAAATSIAVTSVSPAAEDYGADTPTTITAVLSWSGSGAAPTASHVTIGGNGNGSYGATSCGAASGNTITCTSTYTPTTADTPGSYTETAAFTADGNYSAASSTQTNNFAINAATSTTAVSSSLNPSVLGQSVTFTATINGENGAVKGRVKQRVVSGSVTWSANTGCGTTSVTAGNPGTATCTTTSLGVGTDAITATYSGDSNHSGSTGTLSGGQVVSPVPLSQTITFTTPAPATAKSGDAFTVAATGGGSGNPVTFSVGTGSVCILSGSATYTMISNSGFCYVVANQAGNSNYAAAPQVTETVTAVKTVTKVAPTVTFTGAPSSAAYLSTFTVATTQNSGITPTITSTPATVCTVSGNVVTMKNGTGTCTVKAAWATNAYYLAASLTQSVTATKLATTTAITNAVPQTNPLQVEVYFGVSNGANAVAGNVTVTASPSGKHCTGTVATGKCLLTFTAAGSQTLTAVYAGNTDNTTSTSAPYGITVQ